MTYPNRIFSSSLGLSLILTMAFSDNCWHTKGLAALLVAIGLMTGSFFLMFGILSKEEK